MQKLNIKWMTIFEGGGNVFLLQKLSELLGIVDMLCDDLFNYQDEEGNYPKDFSKLGIQSMIKLVNEDLHSRQMAVLENFLINMKRSLVFLGLYHMVTLK